jgi:hypothetical protein
VGISAWLRELGLERYEEAFETNTWSRAFCSSPRFGERLDAVAAAHLLRPGESVFATAGLAMFAIGLTARLLPRRL